MTNDLKARPAYMEADWFQALVREVKASTQTAVAQRMGVSRVTLCIFLHGKGEYGNGGAKPDRMELRYRRAFEQLTCPHTGQQVGVDHCRSVALRTAPTHNPMQLGHWKACQVCQYKPAPLEKPAKPRRAARASADVPMAVLDTRTMPLPEVGGPQINPTPEENA
ncbi:MarR family transcriptional regulator [Cupriavidus gilardii]|uniref:MarR family transcriptional regulator n=1 Tax=Cupriavidus gilardii TaxID=82541 RepID=A0ABY4VM48_9BURK|nr:MarR family transcriptional regulator [Cupriavidus gilardii]USE78093.1 MarR family transcriptional regulator [Cupriavidus gilardii]